MSSFDGKVQRLAQHAVSLFTVQREIRELTVSSELSLEQSLCLCTWKARSLRKEHQVVDGGEGLAFCPTKHATSALDELLEAVQTVEDDCLVRGRYVEPLIQASDAKEDLVAEGLEAIDNGLPFTLGGAGGDGSCG